MPHGTKYSITLGKCARKKIACGIEKRLSNVLGSDHYDTTRRVGATLRKIPHCDAVELEKVKGFGMHAKYSALIVSGVKWDGKNWHVQARGRSERPGSKITSKLTTDHPSRVGRAFDDRLDRA